MRSLVRQATLLSIFSERSRIDWPHIGLDDADFQCPHGGWDRMKLSFDELGRPPHLNAEWQKLLGRLRSAEA